MAEEEALIASIINADPNNESQSQATQELSSQPPAPSSPFEGLQNHLKDNPYDAQAWSDLVGLAEESGELNLISTAYDELLKVYPNLVQAQLLYLHHSLSAHPIGRARHPNADDIPPPQNLFSGWLKTSPEVPLWKAYLSYVVQSQSLSNTQHSATQRDTIKKAYEFALRFVGQSIDAGEVWKDYIDYLKNTPTTNDREGQEKMDTLRSIYRRAVQIPLANLEAIWREWDSFENGLNKLTAKKFLADVSPDYMTARTKKTELLEHFKRLGIQPSNTLSLDSIQRLHPEDIPTPPILGPAERSLVASWRKYLEWEESNPLEIGEKSQLNARLLSVYRKGTIRMRFYPELWYLAYMYASANGKPDEGTSFLQNGLHSNPTSFLLNFAFSEHQESALMTLQTTPGTEPKKIEEKKAEGHELFKTFIGRLRKELEDIEAIQLAEGGKTIAVLPPPNAPPSTPVPNKTGATGLTAGMGALEMDGLDGDEEENPEDILMRENEIFGIVDPSVLEAREREKERQKENERREAVMIDKRIELGQASLAWMRYAKRVGQSTGLRNVFKEVRGDRWVSWQVFEAAAMLEHQISPTGDVAAKIFELGLRFFSSDVDYVVRYLNFLIGKGDEGNARALFEKSVTALDPEKARPIWQRWLQYQMGVADLPTLLKLDKRIQDAYPKDRAVKLFAQRYTYLGNEIVPPPFGIDAIASHDLQTALRIPSVLTPPTLVPQPTPLVPHPSPPMHHASTYAHTSYAHAYQTPSLNNTPSAPPKPSKVNSPIPNPKRPLPDMEHGGGGGGKRQRRSPPPPPRRQPPAAARDGRRWGSPPPPPLDRRRERSPNRDGGGGYGVGRGNDGIPNSVLWFLAQLPNATSYDGPVFKTDEYLKMLANISIPPPSAVRIRSRSPPPRGTRGMPDYSDYKGPGARPRRY